MKRFSLRGGAAGIIIGAVVDTWGMTQQSCVGLNVDGTSGCPKGVDIFLSNLASTPLYEHLFILGIFLVLGSLIGFIYGKIKNRKK